MKKDIRTKREMEKELVSEMIALYCRKRRGNRNGLCLECAALDAYARERSDKYANPEVGVEMWEKIRAVMRFSGPRMIFCHPVIAVRHAVEMKKEKKRLEDSHET